MILFHFHTILNMVWVSVSVLVSRRQNFVP